MSDFDYDSFMIAREKIIEKVSIPDYYMDYIDEDKDLTVHNKDCCPLHDESTPSFFYVEDRNFFYCQGCEKGGSVIELHYHAQRRQRDQYLKSQAVMDLAKMYNIDIPNLFGKPSMEHAAPFMKHKKLKIKKKSELRMPVRKVEKDLEVHLGKVLKESSAEKKADMWSRFDDIFFRRADVKMESDQLKKLVGSE